MLVHARHWFAIAALAMTGTVAPAAVVFDESVDGPLSRDNDKPTALTFAVGENTVAGTISRARTDGDVDVYTFNVPIGAVLDSIALDTFESLDNLAFFAIDSGTMFPYDVFDFDDVANGFLPESAYLGGTVFGPSDITNDVNLLTRAGNIGGARFTGPLPADDYSIYVQQTGASTDYSLTFNVTSVTAVPEPGSMLALATVGAVLWRRRRS